MPDSRRTRSHKRVAVLSFDSVSCGQTQRQLHRPIYAVVRGSAKWL